MSANSGQSRGNKDKRQASSPPKSRVLALHPAALQRSPGSAIAMLFLAWLGGIGYLTWSYLNSTQQYRDFAHSQIEQRTELLARLQSELLTSHLEHADQTLRSVRQFVTDFDQDRERLTTLLHAQNEPAPHITELLYFDLQGDIIAWTHGNPNTPNVYDRDYFRTHLAGGDTHYISLPMVARIQNETPFVAISRPVLGPEEELMGVIVAALDLPTLAGGLGDVTANEHVRSVVVHSSGEIMMTSPFTPVVPGTRMSLLERPNLPLGEAGLLIENPAPDGINRQVAYTTLPDWGLQVFVGEDRAPVKQDVAAFVREQQHRYALIALIGTALVIALGWLAWRRRQAVSQLHRGERALAASYQRNQAIVSALPDTLVTVSARGKVLDFEPGEGNELPLPTDRFMGRHISAVLPRSLARKVLEYVRLTLDTDKMQTFEHRALNDNEEEQYFEVRSTPLGPDEVLLIVLNITARKTAQKKLQWQATHDSLTSLPNRVLFYDRLRQAITSSLRYERPASLLYLDMDGFKAVNDSLGHHAGDELLRQIAARLREVVRESDTVARLAGDEFAVIALECGPETAQGLVDKISEALGQDYNLGPHTACLSASVGIASCPRDGTDVDTLVRVADQSMYSQKHQDQEQTELAGQ
ncbi:diguanylate cyclase [Natronospirillum operosum]|uniref:Diguanylate cyclase n=1 Tax=Natronospirillum operosum TaxID=2759953 RepID=A0A4Z0WDY1_9GAMM|nr:diguanylate cyclase [Natronospirillum operosum]TGG92341.1 diguanylate cyclase [Natronospirillum operosum]